MNKFYLIFALILFACNRQEKLELTYIAQSGVFAQSGEKKLFVDAFFTAHPKWKYPAPSTGFLDSMERALPPYDNIDLILVTHAHVDHFNPNSIEKALKNNPKALFVSTPVVEKQLKNKCLNYRDDKAWPDTVYSFWCSINGNKMLHNGGSTGFFEKEYQQLRYDSLSVDLAVLYHHFLSDPNTKGKHIIENYIKPKQILLGHQDFETPSYMDSIRLVNENHFPNLDVMNRQKQMWVFD